MDKVKYWTIQKELTLAKCNSKIDYHTKRAAQLARELMMVECHLDGANADYVAKEAFYNSRIESAAKKSDAEQNGSA